MINLCPATQPGMQRDSHQPPAPGSTPTGPFPQLHGWRQGGLQHPGKGSGKGMHTCRQSHPTQCMLPSHSARAWRELCCSCRIACSTVLCLHAMLRTTMLLPFSTLSAHPAVKGSLGAAAVLATALMSELFIHQTPPPMQTSARGASCSNGRAPWFG